MQNPRYGEQDLYFLKVVINVQRMCAVYEDTQSITNLLSNNPQRKRIF